MEGGGGIEGEREGERERERDIEGVRPRGICLKKFKRTRKRVGEEVDGGLLRKMRELER